MPVVQAAKASSLFDLRSAALTLIVVAVRTTDLAALESELAARLGAGSDMFDGDPVAIDLAQVGTTEDTIDFPALMALLRRFGMVPVVARGGNEGQMAAARAAGLADAPAAVARPAAAQPKGGEAPAEPRGDETPAETGADEATGGPQGDGAADEAKAAVEPEPAPAAITMVVDRPLRSGQRVYARGGDLVVLEVVSFGAEVIADGNVHVYAPLRGRAVAGALGDTRARIFTVCMEAQLISIAGLYRSGDEAVPRELRGKPAQARLQGEKLVLEELKF